MPATCLLEVKNVSAISHMTHSDLYASYNTFVDTAVTQNHLIVIPGRAHFLSAGTESCPKRVHTRIYPDPYSASAVHLGHRHRLACLFDSRSVRHALLGCHHIAAHLLEMVSGLASILHSYRDEETFCVKPVPACVRSNDEDSGAPTAIEGFVRLTARGEVGSTTIKRPCTSSTRCAHSLVLANYSDGAQVRCPRCLFVDTSATAAPRGHAARRAFHVMQVDFTSFDMKPEFAHQWLTLFGPLRCARLTIHPVIDDGFGT